MKFNTFVKICDLNESAIGLLKQSSLLSTFFGSWTTDTDLINGPKFFKDFIIIEFFLILLLLFYYSNLT